MAKTGEFVPKGRKEERNMTACGGPQTQGAALDLGYAVSEVGHASHSNIFHGLFTLSFPDDKEQGWDVKENNYGLNRKLSSGTPL